MGAGPTIIRRRLVKIAQERADEAPVLLLQGPRSVGKSTTLHALAATHDGTYLDLDDPVVAEAAVSAPTALLAAAGRTYIDEYQRAPVLLDAIKARLNQDGQPGQFVLAGSTSFDALPSGAQALTGRLLRLPVYPLAQSEIDGTSGSFLRSLLEDPDGALTPLASSTRRDEYERRVVRGGFPSAVLAATEAGRQRWFSNYVAQTLTRDVPSIEEVRRPDALRTMLGLLAARTGQVLNTSNLAREASVNPKTAGVYVDLLLSAFVIQLLRPWAPVATSRSFKRPKVHILDTGLGAHLLRLSREKLASRTAESLTAFGQLLESFVAAELLKEVSWLDVPATVGYWRTYEGAEVDLVVETWDGSVLGFEVKAAQRLRDGDLAGLRALRAKVGPAFKAGVVLHTGALSAHPEDRLFTMPIDRLWR
jgi:predicted AAA+ superfamily ATPase